MVGVDEDGRGNREAGQAGWHDLGCGVLEPEGPSHREIRIGQHRRVGTMLAHALANLCGGIRAERDEPNAPFIEITTKLFPSPQLGDTVGSPVASEEFDQDGMASEALDFEALVVVIGGAEDRERLPEDQIRFLFRLACE